MVWRLRKLKSVRETQTGAGLSFVVSVVKAQQGEPPRQFVRSPALLSQGATVLRSCSYLHQIKYTPTQRLHSDTVTLLIYPACFWVLLPLKQLATVFLFCSFNKLLLQLQCHEIFSLRT